MAVLAGLCLLAALYRSALLRSAAPELALAGSGLGYPYLCWVAAWSGATFLLYVLDKIQALRGGPRVPEKVLHRLAAAGGFPGGWAGMFGLRHKIRHPSFWAWLLAASAVHGAILYGLLRYSGIQ
jgi:uncharacterized membrane protein YsdA (DUF1294 family)